MRLTAREPDQTFAAFATFAKFITFITFIIFINFTSLNPSGGPGWKRHQVLCNAVGG
jgi:hypothetical protein